jgi:HlyB family type I secretion system ABC transporter
MVTSSLPTDNILIATFGLPASSPWRQRLGDDCPRLTPTLGEDLKSHCTTGLYVVVTGKVRILDTASELQRSLQPGDVFLGEMLHQSAPDGSPAQQFRAGLNLQLVHVQSALLRQLLKQHPAIEAKLSQHLQHNSLRPASRAQTSTQTASTQTAPTQTAWQHPATIATPSTYSPAAPRPLTASPAANNVLFPKPTGSMRRMLQRLTHQYPYVQQQSAVDCGVTCLVMIGLYWGKRLDLNHLRNLANIDRRGATLKGLMMAAEAVGFTARPVKASLDQLAKQPLPAIVHWEGKHYVVVYEVTPREVLVADPELGRRRYTHAQFNQGWTGYTVILQPTIMLQQAPAAKQSLNRFIALLQPHRLVLGEIMIASLLIQIFGLITPILTQLLLDRVVVQRSASTLIAVGIGLLVVSIFRIVLSSIRQYLLYHTANRIDLALIVGFISHAFRLKLSYFEKRYVGDIMSRISENEKIRRFITGDAITTVLDLLMVFVYLGLMFWYSWPMAALALMLIPILGAVTLGFGPFLRQISREEFTARTQESSYLIEALSGVGTVKSMGLERRVRWHWEHLFSRYIKLNFASQVMRERLRFVGGLVEMLFSQSLLLFGIWQVIHDQLTIGQMMAFNMLLGNVMRPFMRLIDLWDDFQEILISIERLNDVLDAEPEEGVKLNANQLLLPTIQGEIRFENVTFRYNLESPKNTIENLSFSVTPGQTIALVGRSGSGKTTIAKLLLGLYLPTDGKIWIDGYDLSTVSLRSLRQQVGVVDQNTFLFGGSIRDNLTIAHPESTLADITAAAKLAGADRFIDAMPMQYDTQIGESGSMLSGGQRQRLAITRALLGNPRLLVFDEATSSLDAETERLIQTNLSAVLSRQTTFIIAHRLSTIRNADLILVLDQGVLVESGTHDALMAKRGQYYYLNQQQLTTIAA